MKKMLVVTLAALLAAAMPSAVLAAFEHVDEQEVSASVTIDSPVSGGITVSIEGGASGLSWSDVSVPGTEWKVANEYIELKNTYTRSNYGIQIYTDNMAADASPKFTGDADLVNPAGLVATDATDKVLPLCWRITDATTDTLEIIEDTSHHLYNPTLASDYFCFLWMKDASTKAIAGSGTTAFQNADDYVTAWDERGIHHGEGALNWGVPADDTAYIYVGAKFTGASTARTYSTSKLIVELFYQ